MTETEWLTCGDLEPMFGQLSSALSERKLRLFGVACCRRISQLLVGEHNRAAVEVAERFADGLAGARELRDAQAAAKEEWEHTWAGDDVRAYPQAENPGEWVACEQAELAATEAADHSAVSVGDHTAGFDETSWDAAFVSERAAQSSLLREIVGNPFRPVSLDSSWLTRSVRVVAQAIYDERRFEDLPILADALEDVGCADADILSHCRSTGPHVRGCWAVDLLLGKQ
jgi:hypothetical protein